MPNSAVASPTSPLISHAEVQAIFDLAPDGIFMADLDGRFTYVNPAGCAMLGYECDEVIGRNIVDLIPPEDVPRLVRSRSAMLEGKSDADEWRLRRKDGTWLPVEVHANILPDGRWQGFVRDISARKAQQAERDALFARMDEDRRWLRAVMDQMPLGVVLYDANGKITYNDRAEQIMGMKFSPDAGSEQYAGRIFHPDGRPVPRAELPSTRVMDGGERVIAAEYLVRRADGTQVPILGSAAPIVASDGRLLGGVGVFQDVSERMALERTVRQNERLLKAMFEILPVGVWIADERGTILLGNPAGKRIWEGIRHVGPEHFGQYEGWWLDSGRPIAPDEWGIARAVTRGETSRRELIRIKCFDGSFKTIINWAGPIRNDAGEITGAVAVNEDVTVLHQTQEQLRLAVRDREHLLAVVAHDLRNPLLGISLRAALGQQKAQALGGAEELRANAAAIGDIARAMSGLVDDLLAISSGGARSMLNFQPVATDLVVRKAVDAARPILEDAGLHLEVAVPAELPPMHIDLNRVLRVFANLLDNAAKFTDRGGRVVITAQPAQGAVKFSVANSGPALSKPDMERLFLPFWQADSADGRGAGLGLSICRSIIEAHGGSIWTEPAPGMRVRVRFLLPCVRPLPLPPA